uniref:Uncharacterized protein n=1 Tax=Sciurus vulgaris TaxID=55149 RepID=A0A8D2JLV3_SCIVU
MAHLGNMRSRWVWRLLRDGGSGGHWFSAPRGRFSLALRRDFLTTTIKEGYDRRPVDITPLEQRKLTFDTHALVQDLETHGNNSTTANGSFGFHQERYGHPREK